jgi:hypothetical protein
MSSTKDERAGLKRLAAGVAAALLAVSLSSCSLLRPEFSEMSAAYGEVVEKYQVEDCGVIAPTNVHCPQLEL